MKAGAVSSGEQSVEDAVHKDKARLLIVAEDASANTRKKMRNMAAYFEIPLIVLGTKEELGHCVGKNYRSMLAVLNQGFAESIQKKLPDQ
jgi:ribosomal protein L7Ae-like RNA K-turn-binding protein